MKKQLAIVLFAMIAVLSNNANADNLIYIDQAGDNATITLTQDGSGNKIGDSGTEAKTDGDNTTVSITQTGSNNTVLQNQVGDDITTTINQSGSGNSSTLTTGTNGGSDTITYEENITGNNNTIITNVGTSAATNLATINIDVTGNTNAITVNENSASSGLTAKITDIDVIGNSNTITATKTGLGQHDTIINHTGDLGTIGVTQSGSVNSTVNLLTNGNNATVSVTITD